MRFYITIFIIVLAEFSIGQEIVESSLSSCDNKSFPEYIRNRLIEKEIKNDTLFLNVGLVLNCCTSPSPNLTFKNDSLFLEIIENSGIWCACECCFELEIKVTGILDTNFVLIHQIETSDFTDKGMVHQTEYSELKHQKNKYIFPDPIEVNNITRFNETNELGLKVGLWNIYYEKSKKVKYKVYYSIDSAGNSTSLWRMSFDKKGNIIDVCAKTGPDESTCAEGYVYSELMNLKP